MTASIVYLSSQPTHNPCATTTPTGGGLQVDCGDPISTLAPGGVLIHWYSANSPGIRLSRQPGKPTRFDTLPARLLSGPADAECRALGGTRSVNAAIDPEAPASGPALIFMDACLAAPAQTSAVTAMLASLAFPSTPVAGS